MVNSSKIDIKKFNGKSFELWKPTMEDILIDKDQWLVVDLGTACTSMPIEDWTKLDRKAKIIIQLCLSYSMLLNVSREATTKAL